MLPIVKPAEQPSRRSRSPTLPAIQEEPTVQHTMLKHPLAPSLQTAAHVHTASSWRDTAFSAETDPAQAVWTDVPLR